MRIILLQDVKNIGKKGEVVTVSDGYASNFLIPRKLAVISTDKSQEVLAKQNEEKRKQLELLREEAIKNKKALENITLEFVAKAAPDGRMLGTISYKQVADELKNKFNIDVDKRKIISKFIINAFGFTRLKIELFKDVIGTINIHVSEMK